MASASFYRKRPITISAMLFDGTGQSATAISDWMAAHGHPGVASFEIDDSGVPSAFIIQTLEGAMTAAPGDYILRGVHGEFYPCKPDIFAETYEPA